MLFPVYFWGCLFITFSIVTSTRTFSPDSDVLNYSNSFSPEDHKLKDDHMIAIKQHCQQILMQQMLTFLEDKTRTEKSDADTTQKVLNLATMLSHFHIQNELLKQENEKLRHENEQLKQKLAIKEDVTNNVLKQLKEIAEKVDVVETKVESTKQKSLRKMEEIRVKIVSEIQASNTEIINEIKDTKKNNRTNKNQCLPSESAIVKYLEVEWLNDKYYFVSYNERKRNWSDAQDFCKSRGMDLVSVESLEEWDALSLACQRLAERFGVSPWSSGRYITLGGTNVDAAGLWHWTATDEHISDFHKFKYMPNARDNYCLYLNYQYWDTAMCTAARPFICELKNPASYYV